MRPASDQLLLIRIEGMHCYRCEETIRRSLERQGAIYEVEVDFPSSQCSVLFDPARGDVERYVGAVSQAGYRVTGTTILHAPGHAETEEFSA